MGYARPIIVYPRLIQNQGNVFVDSNGHALLADFGLVSVGESTLGRMSTTNGSGGSMRYMAPERIDPATQALRRKPAVDVYAFACLSYLVSFP
jgi:serine/threonine protein kinase